MAEIEGGRDDGADEEGQIELVSWVNVPTQDDPEVLAEYLAEVIERLQPDSSADNSERAFYTGSLAGLIVRLANRCAAYKEAPKEAPAT